MWRAIGRGIQGASEERRREKDEKGRKVRR
jgi:hypothetical protein